MDDQISKQTNETKKYVKPKVWTCTIKIIKSM